MMTEATRMTEPIFFRYCTAFSHMCSRVLRAVGIRYGGSSITNCSELFLNFVFFSNRAVQTATAMPSR